MACISSGTFAENRTNVRDWRVMFGDVWQTRDSPVLDGVVGSRSYDAISDVKIGHVIPNFHKRKNMGELLPYTSWVNLTREVDINGPSTIAWGHDTSHSELHLVQARRPFLWDYTLDDVSPLHCRNILDEHFPDRDYFVRKAAAKIYSRGWDALTFVAEFNQVVRMFRNVGPQIIEILKDAFELLRSGKLYKLGHDSIDSWLQTRYGWRVLLYDIKDINELLSNLGENERKRVKDRTGENKTVSYDRSYETGGSMNRIISDITVRDLRVRGCIIADFIPDQIVTNPVKTAWELVPYSFVIDWFINIGSFLDSVSFVAANPTYTASIGTYIDSERNVSTTITYSGWWATHNGYSNLDQVTLKDRFSFRERLPTCVNNLPSWKVNLDGYKVTDLIALFLQLFK